MFYYFFLIFFSLYAAFSSLLFSTNTLSSNRLKINLIAPSWNGKGLETDIKVLSAALEKLGCEVTVLYNYHDGFCWHRAHINIFLQDLAIEKLPMALQNWLIPNPEWYSTSVDWLDRLDLILCRTNEVQRIFSSMNKPTFFLGFTSPDCSKRDIVKNYHHFLHLAGGSLLKGTKAIKQAWCSNPHFPLLSVVKFVDPFVSKEPHLECISNRLPEDQLRLLQNECGIHLCPSETEGFGHYIMEAMSTGAVVVTTNAPPMNEFIHHTSCLVPWSKKTQLFLATSYQIDAKNLQQQIETLLKMPYEELKAIGEYNRELYLDKQAEFNERLEELISSVTPLADKKIE